MIRAALIGAACSLLAACASPSRTDSAASQPMREASASFSVLEERPPTGAVAGADLAPLDIGSSRFTVLDEKGAPIAHIEIVRTATKEHAASIASAEGASRTEFWAAGADGGVVMPAVIEHEDNALTLFDPPLAIAPPSLAAAEPSTSTASMRVMDLKNPSRERHSGQARQTITYAAWQRIRIGQEVLEAQRIDIHFVADLKLAKADDKTSLFVLPGMGIIARQSVSEIKVLGAFGTTTRRTLVREGLTSLKRHPGQ